MKIPNSPGIYQIRNIKNNKIYVGSATSLLKRWQAHKCLLNKNKHDNKYLQHAWNKYLQSSFIFEIIKIVDKTKSLTKEEQTVLDDTKCYVRSIGYNIQTKANSTIGYKHSEKTKQKLRIAALKRKENGNAKITKKCANNIRDEYLKGRITYKELANKYNISAASISKILENKVWFCLQYEKRKDLRKDIFKKKLSRKFSGINNPRAKLNRDIVLKIRNFREQTSLSYAKIAKQFNITTSTAHKICTNKTWKEKE